MRAESRAAAVRRIRAESNPCRIESGSRALAQRAARSPRDRSWWSARAGSIEAVVRRRPVDRFRASNRARAYPKPCGSRETRRGRAQRGLCRAVSRRSRARASWRARRGTRVGGSVPNQLRAGWRGRRLELDRARISTRVPREEIPGRAPRAAVVARPAIAARVPLSGPGRRVVGTGACRPRTSSASCCATARARARRSAVPSSSLRRRRRSRSSRP
jgi:hypothetical protein